jgi:hypothetical protein
MYGSLVPTPDLKSRAVFASAVSQVRAISMATGIGAAFLLLCFQFVLLRLYVRREKSWRERATLERTVK